MDTETISIHSHKTEFSSYHLHGLPSFYLVLFNYETLNISSSLSVLFIYVAFANILINTVGLSMSVNEQAVIITTSTHSSPQAQVSNIN